MITERMENGMYQSFDGDRLLLTITDLGNNCYRAVNSVTDITVEAIPLDDYRTKISCIEHKRAGKDGRYRKTKKLINHSMSWMDYILQEVGFIRKAKCAN